MAVISRAEANRSCFKAAAGDRSAISKSLELSKNLDVESFKIVRNGSGRVARLNRIFYLVV